MLKRVMAAQIANTTHGMTNTRVFRIWTSMLSRCNTPSSGSYKNYGAKGIKVCPEWSSFEKFLLDMGLPENDNQIERINNNGNYEPGNCKWATRKEQCRNRSTSHFIEFNGSKKTLTEWAEIIGISPQGLRRRIFALNWSIEKALTKRNKNDK